MMSINKKERANQIVQILKNSFSVPQPWEIADDPFKVLVRTVISQSTAELNTRRAYANLLEKGLLTPERLSRAEIHQIEDALRIAGLFRNKSRVLKDISELIIEKFDGSLDFIFSLPFAEARERLMSLPGVGPKTADIVLLFSAKRPTLPVDTHVNRVTKRLGLASAKADYEGVRSALQSLYLPEAYFEVHMLFIELGRKICKALKPLCLSCPINKLCPSARI